MYHVWHKVLVVAVLAAACTATAQEWPTQPVKIVVTVPPGNAPDLLARTVGAALSAKWGKPVVIENRPGASGMLGIQAMLKSAGDGHTFAFIPSTVVTVVPLAFNNPGFDVDRDLEPVASVADAPMLIAANPKFPAATLAEVIAQAKAQPDKVSLANPTLLSIPHLFAEMINQRAQIRLFHVPFQSANAAIVATINGDTQLVIEGPGAIMPHVRSDRLKAIAISSPRKLPGLESIPLVSETLPDMSMMVWMGVVAAKGTPDALLERLNRDITSASTSADMRAKLGEFGFVAVQRDLRTFRQLVADDRRTIGDAFRTSGLKAQ
jgi:tripartite-type tricarboxylate transporter receptor subunit TctC